MSDAYLKDFGERVAARRKSLNLTQEQIAEKMDVSIQMISNLERGRKAVRLSNLIKLSEALNISCDYLLSGKRTENDNSSLSVKLSKLPNDDYNMIEMLVDYCLAKNADMDQ